MDLANILIAACTVISTVLTLKFWLMSSIDEKFKSIDARFDKIDRKLDSIEQDIKGIDRRVSIIEGYLMGRDFRNTGSGK